MLNEMTGVELGMWFAMARVDPWGEERSDLRAGIVASTIVNWSGRSLRENANPHAPQDYMPYVKADREHNDRSVSSQIRAFFMNRGK